MRQLINTIEITGTLVNCELEEITTKAGAKAIGGEMVLRTEDLSEHTVRLFSNKYKKDPNGDFTNELNFFYEKYTALSELTSLANMKDGETAAIVRVNGEFSVNDYKSKTDNRVVTINNIMGRFVNVIPQKEHYNTVLEAKFEIEVLIEKMEDEIVKDEPTGNLIVKTNAIRQTAEGFGANANYSVDSLIPIKMTVPKKIVAGFHQAGYYDGCFCKFVGRLVNTVEIIERKEEQAFGEDVIKTFRNYVRMYEIMSGNTPMSMYEVDGLSDDIVSQLIAKRKATLAEVGSGFSNANPSDVPFGKDDKASKSFVNPFAP